MWNGRERARLCLFVALLAACEGPRVLPALADDDLTGEGGSSSSCEAYCGDGTGCDRDCEHACEVGRALCPMEWDRALACNAEEARCDSQFGLPVAPPGCEDAWDDAERCAPHAACAAEESFELCDGCCAGWEIEGAQKWQLAFRDCACAACPSDCGSLFSCGTDSGSDVACQSCTARFCTEEVSSVCRADDDCHRYDTCVMGCPTDDSSHCSEHPTYDACYDCCVADFADGATRFDELFDDCACGACEPDCFDTELCQGFDVTSARCETCIDATCRPAIEETCGGEPRCNAFMVCTAACP